MFNLLLVETRLMNGLLKNPIKDSKSRNLLSLTGYPKVRNNSIDLPGIFSMN
jgi:hypothetical protein